MKRITVFLVVLVLTLVATAQTLNVKTGSVTYLFPAEQTGEMLYDNGTTVTIMGKTFALSDIDAMTVDNAKVTDNSVAVSYDGTSAIVTVAGNVAQYVTPTVSGAHVTIFQTNTDAVDDDDVLHAVGNGEVCHVDPHITEVGNVDVLVVVDERPQGGSAAGEGWVDGGGETSADV